MQRYYSLFSYQAYTHLRDRTPELASLAAFQANVQPIVLRRAGSNMTESVPSAYVSANYFTTLGVRPAAGRLLQLDDDRPGAEPVFVMSHRVWTDRFARDPSVLGRRSHRRPDDDAGRRIRRYLWRNRPPGSGGSPLPPPELRLAARPRWAA
jgi:hypothetical protein